MEVEAAAAAAAAAAPLFVRQTPRTPAELEAAFPPGSGEIWYVVVIGREPGLYHTPYVPSPPTSLLLFSQNI